MIEKLLICTDLDRTLLPNGEQAQSSGAMEMFHKIVARPDVALCFVTGRDKSLVIEAIKVFGLPRPDFVISDVGTNIYSISTGTSQWTIWPSWHNEISRYWHGRTHAEMVALLQPFPVLNLQEPHKQSEYKLSFYVSPADLDSDLIADIESIFKKEEIEATIVSSINEATQTGLLDILPKNADKLHAIKFLIAHENYNVSNTIFAGDSGNDVAVFSSDIKSVCVHNATREVKELAKKSVRNNSIKSSLYIARGGMNNFNGNYSAGIIEGIAHFYPGFINF